MNIIERLEASADWVEENALYHFAREVRHEPYRKSKEAADTMREAAKLMRNNGLGELPFSRELPVDNLPYIPV